jgi:hypothetical protein
MRPFKIIVLQGLILQGISELGLYNNTLCVQFCGFRDHAKEKSMAISEAARLATARSPGPLVIDGLQFKVYLPTVPMIYSECYVSFFSPAHG